MRCLVCQFQIDREVLAGDVGSGLQLDVAAPLARAFKKPQAIIDLGAVAELDRDVLLVGEDAAELDENCLLMSVRTACTMSHCVAPSRRMSSRSV